jgi:succinate dehydrogenase/fumarate reductase flavoprotein subunit
MLLIDLSLCCVPAAVEANYQPAVDLLLAFGAAPYDNGGGSDDEGELFGKVAQKHAMNQEQKQVAKAEAAAAEAAKNVMAENMQLMKERGEKLENMDDKASQVRQDAEEMKQLSQQLKEKMKKKNTWFGL